MEEKDLRQLEATAKKVRFNILEEICSIGSGHVGGSFSVVEALVTLYFKEMNVDPKNPRMEDRDRFVLSKGHAGPALYAVLAQKGFFPMDWLKTLNQGGTNLPSHADMNKTPGVDFTAGSLGQGISAAVGIAYGAKLKNKDFRVYAMIGDGESQEGQVWEALISASNLGLDNLTVFLDYNEMQLDGPLSEIVSMGSFYDKFKAFGFDTVEIDGHDIEKIVEAIENAKKVKGKPQMIILKTVKGKGLPFIEEMGYKNHSMPVTEETVESARKFLCMMEVE